GEQARRQRSPSWRYTLLGYLIHHGSSVFWAGLYESRAAAAIIPRPGPRAAATAAVAAAVDYGIVPRRFNPGFDSHLSLPAMAATYAMFGLGLWLGTRSHRPRVNRASPAVRGHARRDR